MGYELLMSTGRENRLDLRTGDQQRVGDLVNLIRPWLVWVIIDLHGNPAALTVSQLYLHAEDLPVPDAATGVAG
jgi:hypothetical protein